MLCRSNGIQNRSRKPIVLEKLPGLQVNASVFPWQTVNGFYRIHLWAKIHVGIDYWHYSRTAEMKSPSARHSMTTLFILVQCNSWALKPRLVLLNFVNKAAGSKTQFWPFELIWSLTWVDPKV